MAVDTSIDEFFDERLQRVPGVPPAPAEAVPWRCHRSLIADALMVRGIPVDHITSATRAQPHTLTPFAKVRGTRIIYAVESLPLEFPEGAKPRVPKPEASR